MRFSLKTGLLSLAGGAFLFVSAAFLTRELAVENEVEFVFITATPRPQQAAPTLIPTQVIPTPIAALPTDLLTPTQHLITDTPQPPTLTPTVSPTSTATHTPEPLHLVMITSEVGAFLRGGSGVDYEVVGEALPGSVYKALAYQNRDENRWYLVELPTGETGWVSALVALPAEGTQPEAIALAATMPPTPLPTSTVTPTSTSTPPLEADAYVSYERDKLRLRSAPNNEAEVLTLLAELTPLTLRARTQDNVWYNVMTANGREGWVMSQFVTVNLSLDGVPIIQPTPTVYRPNVNDCISVVGDSMPYGHIIYKIPGYGFSTVRATPFSVVLANQLGAAGRSLTVLDRTVPASLLWDNGRIPYRKSPEYAMLLNDRCRFTVVVPFLNDLSVGEDRPDAVGAHMTDLATLVQTLNQVNPDGEILILGFYYGTPAEFVWSYAKGYTVESVNLFNQRLFEACAPGGTLGVFGNVTCAPIENVLWAVGNGAFAGEAQEETVRASLYEPLPADGLPLFEEYWMLHPDDPIIGDGIHLSEQGKITLAQFVITQLVAINPDW